MSQFKTVPDYITRIRDLTSMYFEQDATEDDAIPCIFDHLRAFKKKHFLKQIEGFHDEYIHNRKNFTVDSLLQEAHAIYTSLIQANKWDDSPIEEDDTIIAMKTALQQQQEVLTQLTALLADQTNPVQLPTTNRDANNRRNRQDNRTNRNTGRVDNRPSPQWKNQRPYDLTEKREWTNPSNGRKSTWQWCDRCNNGQGTWSTTHNTDSHNNNSRNNAFNAQNDNRSNRNNRPPPRNMPPNYSNSNSTSTNVTAHHTQPASNSFDLQKLATVMKNAQMSFHAALRTKSANAASPEDNTTVASTQSNTTASKAEHGT